MSEGGAMTHTHTSAGEEVKGSACESQARKGRGVSLEVSDDLPDQRLCRPEEGKPEWPKKRSRRKQCN